MPKSANDSLRLSLAFFCGAILILLPCSLAAQAVPQELFASLRWRLIGPFRGGRVVAVAGVPGDSTTFYFGAVDGGVWKTTDAGVVWTPIFDEQSVASIGALAVAPSDPKIIYVGTGESDIRSSLSFGNGIYKSTDAGRSWRYLGLEDTRHISKIVVDPEDANTVYVGALGHVYGPNSERGVYKSTNGGEHWTKVLDQGAEIGISDLAICPHNSSLLFAGTWHAWRPPWSTYAPIDRPGGGLFRSRDRGQTWTRMSGSGLPEGDWGRIGVEVASDGKRVYALIQAKKAGLYRSDDGGDHWVLANDDPRLTSRAWYFNNLTIDPNNRDLVYVPNVALYRSEDGGKTISIVRGAPGGDDYHQLWIDPRNSSSMVLGTDQGTTISLDRGQTWSTWYNQPTAQIYHLITDNRFPYAVYGTQQDSGSVAVLTRSDNGQITPRDWFPTGPSESGYLAFDPVDPDIVYLTGPYGSVARFNRKTTLSQDVSPWPASLTDSEIEQRKYRAPWSPVLVASETGPPALYLGTQYVMKTSDGGLNWKAISPDLTGSIRTTPNIQAKKEPTLEEAQQNGFGAVSTIALSTLDPNLIWAGTDTGLVHVTRDGGKSWKEVTPNGVGNWSDLSLIEASHFDPGTAYAAVDRSRLDDQRPYLYRTRDYGANWDLIANGIPAPAFLRAIREDPHSRGLLFAGTELGVYVSFDEGEHWQSLQLNLPVSSVRDLAIHGDDLVIGTHGRSFWVLDNMTPLRQMTAARAAASDFLYHPATAIRVDNDDFVGTPLPPEEATAENPPSGAMIDYVLKVPAKEVKLEIFDAQQKLLRQFSSADRSPRTPVPLPVAERWFPKPPVLKTTPGMHRLVWDLRWGSSGGPVADELAEFRNPSGPKVIPGLYQIRLTVDGQVATESLRVEMDPRSPATLSVLEQHVQLGNQMFATTIEARRAMAEINSFQKQISDIENKPGSQAPQLHSVLAETRSQIAEILKKTDKDSAGACGLEGAYKDLASALRVVESGDRAVPSQAIALYQESSRHVSKCIGEWTTFKQTKLSDINRQLQENRLPPIAISEIEQAVEFLTSR